MTKVTFEDALSDDDWGLIISKEGILKGLFIPDGKDEDDVPDEIIQLCVRYFGIDPEEFYGNKENDTTNSTIH